MVKVRDQQENMVTVGKDESLGLTKKRCANALTPVIIFYSDKAYVPAAMKGSAQRKPYEPHDRTPLEGYIGTVPLFLPLAQQRFRCRICDTIVRPP